MNKWQSKNKRQQQQNQIGIKTELNFVYFQNQPNDLLVNVQYTRKKRLKKQVSCIYFTLTSLTFSINVEKKSHCVQQSKTINQFTAN